jgi:uncharacterized CHY-type Zn-finger protein
MRNILMEEIEVSNNHKSNHINIRGTKVCGIGVDGETRCVHYHSPIDIIASRFPCCDTYYPCFECHNEVADHLPTRWHKDQVDEKAILCGACGHQLTIHEYVTGNSACPVCSAKFNPGCQNHYHLYFDL